jgi:hypothetical protein
MGIRSLPLQHQKPGAMRREEKPMKSLHLRLVAGLILGIALPALAVAAEPADTLTIPAGSTITARLTTTLSTGANEEGDPFTARVIDPVFDGGIEVIPAGSTVEGRVTFEKEPGRVKGRAEMRLLAQTITTPDDNATYSIVAGLNDAEGAEGSKVKDEEGTIRGPGKSKKRAAVEAGVGAAVGAGVGAVAGGAVSPGGSGKGALYGLVIGGVAGLIHSIHKKGKDVILPQGTELTFVIQRTTTAKRVSKPAQSSEETSQ